MVFENPVNANGLANLPHQLRLPLTFDGSAMARDLAALESAQWTAHFVPDNYRGDWSVIPLRAPVGASHPILRITSNPGDKDWEDTEFLQQCPAIASALARFECPTGAVRLMRLGPGSAIHEHRDLDLDAALGTARLHVPLQTNPDVDFRVMGERVEMKVGECWYLRLSETHSVANGGNTARIHLVIDASVNEWLAALLSAAAQGIA